LKPSVTVTAAAYTLPQSARYLNISQSSIRRLIERGELKGNRKLGRWLFPIENLEAWLKE
jgi:excisionase family DNA binding protein